MKEIKLTQGKVALVDDEDYEYINKYHWFADKCGNIYYASRSLSYISINGVKTRKKIRMHTELLNTPKGFETDHINHDGLDNRKENLRVVTKRGNSLNRIKTNKLNLHGVKRQGNRFTSSILINGKQIFLGSFMTPEEAHNVYMENVYSIEKSEP